LRQPAAIEGARDRPKRLGAHDMIAACAAVAGSRAPRVSWSTPMGTPASHDPVLELADRLFAAVAAGDLRTLREEIYAPGCRIWHNGDGVEQTVEQNLLVLGWALRHIAELRYEHIRRQRTATGFVQQHVLRG